MCGIAGIFSRNQEFVPRNSILRMADALKHRGPDDEGYLVDKSFILGHRRLSIIDIKGGKQPLTNEDGSVVVIFNGEIYNYVELRDDLKQKGHQFRTLSDTETLVHLYEDEGPRMFSRLNGMFALAIADLKKKELLLARDRLGKKPLFYFINKNLIVFASEIKSILLGLEVPKEIDYLALYDYLSLNYVPGERTMFKGIHRIPPGSWMLIRQDHVIRNKYWKVNLCFNKVRSHFDKEEAIEELDYILKDAVRLRLRSDVPVGIFMSGGVDSSLIAWKAKELGANLTGFTASFLEKGFSEEKYANEAAKCLDMKLEVLKIKAKFEDFIEKIVYHADDPLADSSCFPYYLLSRETSKKLKVVLSGDGADELFTGYLTYQATLLSSYIRKFMPLNILNLLNHIAWMLPLSDRKVSFEYKLKRFTRGLLMPAGPAHFSWNGTWCEWEKHNLLSQEFKSIVTGAKGTYEFLSSVYNIESDKPSLMSLQIADHCEYLPNDILAKVDRMSMAHGLEVRSPWLDYRIVEWAAKLPYELKLKNKIMNKYLLKYYMKKKFPSRIVNRPKQGFSIPINIWLRENLRDYVEDILSEKSLKETGLFHTENVREMIIKHYKKKAAYGFEIWGLLVFMIWYRMFQLGK